MKIVYQNVFWLLMFAAYNYLCLANQNVITIGAFFDEEDDQAKIALKSVVHTMNTMQQEFEYVVKTQKVARIDSFQCCRLLCNITQEEGGLAAVFSPTSFTSSSIIQSVSANLEIPHFLTSWHQSAFFDDKHTTINFYPDAYLLSQALATIVRNLQWRSFVILYEENDGLVRLQEVLKLQSYNKHSTVMVRQLEGPDCRPLLKEIRASSEHRIILDCKSDSILRVLEQAKEVGLMESSSYNYFLTSLDAHTVDFSSLHASVNITTIRILDPSSEDFQSALTEWEQYADFHDPNRIQFRPFSITTKTALIYDAAEMFMNSVNAVHVTDPIVPTILYCDSEEKWEHGFRIASFMKVKTNPVGVSGPLAFDSTGRRTNFTIYVVGGHRDNVVATWNAESPDVLTFMRSDNDSYDALVKNMQKGVLIVSSRLGPPYLMERKPRFEGDVLTGNARYEGFSMDLIDGIAGILGFKYEFRLAEDGKYGNYDPVTKSWNGLIKDLLDRKADLAICDLSITHQRREVVDFSMPFMRLGISILYKKAEEKDVNMFAFLTPFSTDIWIYTATLYLAVSVILYLVARMAPGDWENPHPCDRHPEELENIWNLKNCLWVTLGSIMTQGCDILPKGISSRMVTSMWWFFSLIMTSCYTANLAALLTMERMEPVIDSAEALAKQTKIKYENVDQHGPGSTQRLREKQRRRS
ncbi:glutamate receptor ionotropic, kainate 2-like isoform X2 [Zophobas morio]|uniref:glutamate receptor ionotropic, kainate 2-like isoform X2 n=1 Tax=Zophobas morio TaxID=2755281 RepID=UPI003082B130